MKLIPIDLAEGEGHNHPDIRTDGTTYLCKIRGRWFAGTFENEWYGLNFIGWVNPVGLQYDKPGTNGSRWESVFELVEKSNGDEPLQTGPDRLRCDPPSGAA